MSSYCGSPNKVAYFVVGVRVPIIDGEKLIYDTLERKFTNLKFSINGLFVSDSLLRALNFSTKQLQKSSKSDFDTTNHKNEFDFPYVRVNVKSKIYLNGKLLEEAFQQQELSKIKESDIRSIRNNPPLPNKLLDFGTIEIITI